MSRIINVIIGVVIGAALMLTAPALATSNPTPKWMDRECAVEDAVNCHWSGGSHKPSQGEAYFRRIPGTNTVCVLFVRKSARDYCQKD